MKIRSARIQDADTLAKLYSTFGYTISPEHIKIQLLRDQSLTQTFVAESSGKIMGVVEFHLIETTYRPEPAGQISVLVVDKTCQSQGIGTLLIKHVETLARSLGCSYLQVASDRIRREAHKFYEKTGLSQATHYYFRKELLAEAHAFKAFDFEAATA